MTGYILTDIAYLVPICAVIAVVYILAKHHTRRARWVEMVRVFAMLVLGIVACQGLMLVLSLVI
jgi:hypothetical protein